MDLINKFPQNTQKVHFQLALKKYHARPEAPPSLHVEWRVKLQHHLMCTLFLQAGGPSVESVPYPTVIVLLPPPFPLSSDDHGVECPSIAWPSRVRSDIGDQASSQDSTPEVSKHLL